MTLIKVDPSLLQGSGQGIQGTGQNISSAGSDVLGAALSAPSYDGQFGPKVAAIGHEAYSRLGNSSAQLDNLGTRLSLKGAEFQAVDTEAINQWNYQGPLSAIPYNPVGNISNQINSILKLGGDFASAGKGGLVLGITLGVGKMWSSVTDVAQLSSTIESGIALGDSLDGLGLAMQWGQDYFEYRDKGVPAIASAIFVDTEIQMGSTLAGAGAGAIIGGILGSVLPGPGTIAGAYIGGELGSQIGGVVGPLAAEWIGPVKAFRESQIDGLSRDMSSGFVVSSN